MQLIIRASLAPSIIMLGAWLLLVAAATYTYAAASSGSCNPSSSCHRDPYTQPGMIYWGTSDNDTRWVRFPTKPIHHQSTHTLRLEHLPNLWLEDSTLALEHAAPSFVNPLVANQLEDLDFARDKLVVFIGSSRESYPSSVIYFYFFLERRDSGHGALKLPQTIFVPRGIKTTATMSNSYAVFWAANTPRGEDTPEALVTCLKPIPGSRIGSSTVWSTMNLQIGTLKEKTGRSRSRRGYQRSWSRICKR